ncbi:MAG: hypothetical protein IPM51_12220, partial [Sphingobacteriaceae bacterium]|nr:hypothetical protein [Sphingobacteriaceae bacterium]
MDQIFVQEIDDVLKMRLPKKSSISGAEWVPCYPENTGALPLATSSTYRFRLPRRGYLCRTKGQTGPFFTTQFTTSANAEGEPWAFIRSMRILIHGIEVHFNQFYNHTYGEWLKMKSSDWLRSDGQQMGIVSAYGASPFGALGAIASGTYFNVPIPDNYSVLTSKNNALPLEYLDVVVEVTLNDHRNFLGASADGSNLASASVANLTLWLPICFVDPEVDNAIKAKLDMADENDAEMFLMPVSDIRVDSQTYDFSVAGQKTFVFNSVSTMCRLLQAKISIDATNTTNYKTLTGLTGGVSQYQYKVDGKNVTQNAVTVASPAIAYPLYQDFVSAYNQINNDNIQMCPLAQATFTGSAATNPAHGAVLASNFSMVANLDSVSKELTGGQKLINNLTLELTNANTGAVSNLYLIQHSNRVLGLARN